MYSPKSPFIGTIRYRILLIMSAELLRVCAALTWGFFKTVQYAFLAELEHLEYQSELYGNCLCVKIHWVCVDDLSPSIKIEPKDTGEELHVLVLSEVTLVSSPLLSHLHPHTHTKPIVQHLICLHFILSMLEYKCYALKYTIKI